VNKCARVRLQRLEAQFGALSCRLKRRRHKSRTLSKSAGNCRRRFSANGFAGGRQKPATKPPAQVAAQRLATSRTLSATPSGGKDFIDAIKMVACRTESALAGELREQPATGGPARLLLRVGAGLGNRPNLRRCQQLIQ